jgi:hypothetical protein
MFQAGKYGAKVVRLLHERLRRRELHDVWDHGWAKQLRDYNPDRLIPKFSGSAGQIEIERHGNTHCSRVTESAQAVFSISGERRSSLTIHQIPHNNQCRIRPNSVNCEPHCHGPQTGSKGFRTSAAMTVPQPAPVGCHGPGFFPTAPGFSAGLDTSLFFTEGRPAFKGGKFQGSPSAATRADRRDRF